MFAYRANFYLYIVAMFLRIVVQVSIWVALYAARGQSIVGIGLQDMIEYVLLSMIVNSLINFNVVYDINERVRKGDIVVDFLRPVHLKQYFFATSMGSNCFFTIFSIFPACLGAVLLYGFRFSADPINLLLFLISLVLAVLLSFYIYYSLSLTVFWVDSAFFVDWLMGAFVQLFAGSMVPLWFYPHWLQSLCNVLPFRLTLFDPISIYLGKMTVTGAMQVIGLQLIWLVVLYSLERLVWHRAQRRVFIQGG